MREMTDIQARVAASNARLRAELANRARLHDAAGKAIVLIWMGAAVFFGAMLSEPTLKFTDLRNQEVTRHVAR